MVMMAGNRTFAIATLLAIWLIWGLNYLRPGVKNDVLNKLPTFGHRNSSSSSAATNEEDLRPLVLYTYAESENARTNLAFFIRNGLHGNADFVFIFNGDTSASSMLPELPNIRIVQRENKCFDIGAHGEVLRQDELWKKYKRFILMNASIRGPFSPTYVPSCWMNAFLGRITDRVKVCRGQLSCFLFASSTILSPISFSIRGKTEMKLLTGQLIRLCN